MKIAVDAMGGDYAPGAVIEGLTHAIREADSRKIKCDFVVVGKEDRVRFYLEKYNLTGSPRIEVVNADSVCEMSDLSTVSLRTKKDSSITVCAKLLKEGVVNAMVTPGHTGATVAATKVLCRTLKGIDRPALAANIPSHNGRFLLVDAGANTDCTPLNLIQFGVMGALYANALMNIEKPRVGLISVGGEDVKGCKLTKETFHLLTALQESGYLPFNFIGNVEANSAFAGETDVLISDGFSGNVMIKSAEGFGRAAGVWLKRVLKTTPSRIIGALLVRSAFEDLKAIGAADTVGGAPLLGINGVCIIGHGGSSPLAVKNAIKVAWNCVNHKLNQQIVEANAKVAEGLAKIVNDDTASQV